MLICGTSVALPPEGFESFGIINNGTLTRSLTSHVGFVNPRWVGDYETFQFYYGTPTYSSGYLTVGAGLTVGNSFADRNAYFLRHDFLFLSRSSLSLKFMHEDFNYIPSGHDSVGIEVNSFVPWGEKTGSYFTIGIFNKWNKFVWNGPYWIPFYLNTNDSYAFFNGTFGIKYGFGQRGYWTVDISTRETFSYHPLDHVGFDLNISLPIGQSSYFRILNGIRTSAFFMGTMTPATYFTMLGFYSQ